MTTKVTSSSNGTVSNERRPVDYMAQPGYKAILSLADFEDNQLFAELRRRGYTGELRFLK